MARVVAALLLLPATAAFLAPSMLLPGRSSRAASPPLRASPTPFSRGAVQMRALEPFRGEAGGGAAFKGADIELVRALSEDLREEGNVTGAETFDSIAQRMEDIKTRSQSRLAASLAYSSASYSDAEEASEEARPKAWAYANKRLTCEGDAIWYLRGKEEAADNKPRTAKCLASFSSGAIVTWSIKINQVQGSMFLGLTTLGVELGSEWSDEESVNAAYYLTDKGNLYNGANLVYNGEKGFKAGDTVKIKLDGDGLYFFVNDEELPACIKPVVGTVRLSACLTQVGDGVSVIGEPLVERERAPEVAVKREEGDEMNYFSAQQTSTLSRSIDDESESLLSKIMPAREVEAVQWQELTDTNTNTVYYWNEATGESTWEKPAGFVSTPKAFLDDGATKLDKVNEGGRELYANKDGEEDSHTTVSFDDYGMPNVDQFVYVDETTCIGCTNCATVARQTFYMNSEHGRARAFRQGGDASDVIEEAVATCPVDCIWYVSWDDLVILEGERKDQVINPAARLVGGNFIESATVMTYYNKKDGLWWCP